MCYQSICKAFRLNRFAVERVRLSAGALRQFNSIQNNFEAFICHFVLLAVIKKAHKTLLFFFIHCSKQTHRDDQRIANERTDEQQKKDSIAFDRLIYYRYSSAKYVTHSHANYINERDADCYRFPAVASATNKTKCIRFRRIIWKRKCDQFISLVFHSFCCFLVFPLRNRPS